MSSLASLPSEDASSQWRKEADKARAMAEKTQDPEAKLALFEIAETFRWLAERDQTTAGKQIRA